MYEEYMEKYGVTKNMINALYNPKQKLKFIDDCYPDSKRTTIQGVLNFYVNIGDIERQKGKDLLDFNIVDIEDIFKKRKVSTASSFGGRKAIIKKYFDWGKENGLISIKKLEKFKYITLENVLTKENVLKKYFKNLDDLIECINTIIDIHHPLEKRQYDVIFITLLLLWCGIEIDQVYKIKIDDFNFNNHCISLDGFNYNLPKRVVDAIQDYLNYTSYVVSVKGGKKVYFYKDTGYLLRLARDSSLQYYSKSGLSSKISKWFNDAVINLNTNNRYFEHTLFLKDIVDSGTFHRFYEYEKVHNVDIGFVRDNIFLRLIYKKSITKQKKDNFVKDYRNWKIVFYGL